MPRCHPCLIAFVLLTACEPAPDTPPVPSPPSTVPVVRLATDSSTFAINSGYQTPTTLVIRDSAAWAGAWATLYRDIDPKPTAPVVAFATEMMVLVGLGQQPNGGHGVFITSATYDSTGAVVIRAEHRMPGSNCMTSMALVQPVDLARLPRTDAAVRFEVTPITLDCRP